MTLKTLAIATTLCVAASEASAQPAPTIPKPVPATAGTAPTRVQYRHVEVRGVRIFYREAGDPSKPTILLLHGFPSSSHMFRELMPLLARDFHLVAPDYPGAGFSEAPAAARFEASFANLADLMAAFTDRLGLARYTLFMQDFGGPVGMRIALKRPAAVQGLIIQNANAYLEGIEPGLLAGIKSRAGPVTPAKRAEAEQVVSRASAEFAYKTGVRDATALDPGAWNMDAWVLESSADARRIQQDLILDYHSNLPEYPAWQAYLRRQQPKTLIVWGKNDPWFLPPGAYAYLRDLPKAELHFYDTGHFALEEDAPAIAAQILRSFVAGGGSAAVAQGPVAR